MLRFLVNLADCSGWTTSKNRTHDQWEDEMDHLSSMSWWQGSIAWTSSDTSAQTQNLLLTWYHAIDHLQLWIEVIKEFRDGNWTLDTSIDIPLKEKDYRCLKCRYYDSWFMMMKHFRLLHDDHDAKQNTRAEQLIQAPFDGMLKKWFDIIEWDEIEVDENNDCAWNAIETLLRKKRWMKQSMKKEDNVRPINGFLARTRWVIVVL